MLRDKSDGFIEYKDYQFDYGFYRFIYARDLVCDIAFPAFIRFEDPPFFVESMIKAKRFYALKIPSYFCYNPHKDLSKKAILSAFSGIKLNAEIAKRYKLVKLLDFTKYRFDEHYDRFLSAGGSEREIYEVFAKASKIWRMLTSPRNKRWCEKLSVYLKFLQFFARIYHLNHSISFRQFRGAIKFILSTKSKRNFIRAQFIGVCAGFDKRHLGNILEKSANSTQ